MAFSGSRRRFFIGGAVSTYGIVAWTTLKRLEEAKTSSAYSDAIDAAIKEVATPLPGCPVPRVLEIGIGSDFVNLVRYPPGANIVAVDTATFSDRDVQRAMKLAGSAGVDLRLIQASVEALPFEDESFDAVVGSFVLCSVNDVEKSIAEISRVLRSGGAYAFVEHVRADEGSSKLSQQVILDPFQQAVAHNCHLARPTDETLRLAAGPVAKLNSGKGQHFSSIRNLERYDVPGMWPISEQAAGVLVK